MVKNSAKLATSESNNELQATCDVLIEKLKSDYDDVFSDQLKKRMIGEPMSIKLLPGAVPRRNLVPRRVPLHKEAMAKQTLEACIADGSIVEVQPKEQTLWLSPVHFVKKRDGLRLTIDCSHLNKSISRPIFPFMSVDQCIAQIPADSRLYSVLDCLSAYHMVQLDYKSSLLCAFLCQWGRFRPNVAPQGLSSSSDEFLFRINRAIQGLEGVVNLADDILICAPNVTVLEKRIRALLDRCRQYQVTISNKKSWCGIEVPFGGYIVSENTVRASPEKVRAIRQFPQPLDRTGIKSFMGTIQFLGKFLPTLSRVMAPIRALNKQNVAFVWGHDQEFAFQEAKRLVSEELMNHHFNPDYETIVWCDSSRTGMACVLQQENHDGRLQTVAAWSRACTAAELNSSILECEAIAVLFAVSKFHHWLFGCKPFRVCTDHRPLVPMFAKDICDITNVKVRRVREKLMPYNFVLVYVASRDQLADLFSRGPVEAPSNESSGDRVKHSDASDVAFEENVCFSLTAWSDPNLSLIMSEAEQDEGYQSVIQAVNDNKDLNNLPREHHAHDYKSIWSDLSVFDDKLLIHSNRIVIPKSARPRLLQLLHKAHCSAERTKILARSLYWFPKMNLAIEDYVRRCLECQIYKPSQCKEPAQSIVATRPLELVGIDVFSSHGSKYLAAVDAFSGWPWCKRLKSETTSAVIDILENIFFEHGFAANIISDGAPNLVSDEMHQWRKKHCINFVGPSSAYYAQGNSISEANVKNCKFLLEKCQNQWHEFCLALMCYRDMPRAGTRDPLHTPAILFLNRRLRHDLPMLPDQQQSFGSEVIAANKKERELIVQRQKEQFNKNARQLPILIPGQEVLIQDRDSKKWTEFGTISSVRDDQRSYFVTKQNGVITLRNRRHLRPWHWSKREAEDSSDLLTAKECDDRTVNLERKIPTVKKNPEGQIPDSKTKTASKSESQKEHKLRRSARLAEKRSS